MTDVPTPENPPAEAPAADEEPTRLLPGEGALRDLIEPFEAALWTASAGQDVVVLPKSSWRAFAESAKKVGFEMAVDVTAVDYLRKRRTRFEVVASLLSIKHGLRLRVRIPIEEDDPTCPSLVPVYPGANFFEREIYDMFGITFEDHPDMTRILMPDDWEGHPLRKDYGVGSVPVQFKEANQVI